LKNRLLTATSGALFVSIVTAHQAKPRTEAAKPILSINNIEVIYDHVILVLKGVSISVPKGGIVAILGANGAGKSTTLKAVSNLIRSERGAVTKGSIELNGERVDGLTPNDLVRRGCIQVMEGRHCFGHLSIEENLLTGAFTRQDGLAGRLVPVEAKNVNYGSYNNEVAYNNMMTKFGFGNASTAGVYYDEENRRHLNTLRAAHAQLAMSLVDAGQKDKAHKVLEDLEGQAKKENISGYQFAVIYAGLGEQEKALAELEKAFKERSTLLGYIRMDPRLDPIRSDRRFIDLQRRIGLQQ